MVWGTTTVGNLISIFFNFPIVWGTTIGTFSIFPIFQWFRELLLERWIFFNFSGNYCGTILFHFSNFPMVLGTSIGKIEQVNFSNTSSQKHWKIEKLKNRTFPTLVPKAT